MLTKNKQIKHINTTLIKFNFPINPIQLLNKIKINTKTKIIPILKTTYKKHFNTPANIISSILNNNHKNKKNNQNFYLYNQKKHKNKKQINPTIYPLINTHKQKQLSTPQITKQYIILILNKTIHYINKQIIHNIHNKNINTIFNINFPPFLNKPFHYINSLNTNKIITIIQQLTTQYNSHFTPYKHLIKINTHKKNF